MRKTSVIVLLISSTFLLGSWDNDHPPQTQTTPRQNPNPNAQPNFSQQVGEELAGSPAKGLVAATQAIANFYGQGRGFNDIPFLNESDANYEPNMDPRGQPRLPSSCFEAVNNTTGSETNSRGQNSSPQGNRNSTSNSNSGNRGNDSQVDSKLPSNDSPKKLNQDSKQKGSNSKKPASNQNDGNTESPFVDEQGIEIADDEDYRLDSKDPSTSGSKPSSPFVDEQGIEIADDEDYRVDSKDPSSLQPNTSNAQTPRSSGGSSNQSGNQSPSSSNSSPRSGNSENGCECLEAAYRRFEENRYTLAKLHIIGSTTKKDAESAMAFGDNFSGIHAVSGLAWQVQRRKIVESLKGLDASYKAKYQELIDTLYNILQEIDHCESLLDNPDWYSRNGFMYYEFTKLRYETY